MRKTSLIMLILLIMQNHGSRQTQEQSGADKKWIDPMREGAVLKESTRHDGYTIGQD